MKQRKNFIMRVAAGVALILLSALITVVIRDVLARRNPENALPVMEVFFSSPQQVVHLPIANSMMHSYSWEFLFGTESGGDPVSDSWKRLEGAWVPPASSVDLEFTFSPREVHVSMASGEGNFVELGGEIKVPREPGEYTYRVKAIWRDNRWVNYYFKIRVPVW